MLVVRVTFLPELLLGFPGGSRVRDIVYAE